MTDEQEVVLVDTNAVIEAVRTGCWAAITGRFSVETVQECYDEALRDAHRPGYIEVTVEDLGRLSAVHAVTDLQRATLALRYEYADGLDDGERDLLAHAIDRVTPPSWLLCSPDKASVRAAVALGAGDALTSLEWLGRQAGARPRPALRDHHTEARLGQWRTAALLGTL